MTPAAELHQKRLPVALCLEYPLGLRGGVSVLVETLLEQFVWRGHRVVLVSPDTVETVRVSQAGKLAAEHFYWNPAKITIASSKNLARQLAAAPASRRRLQR